MYPNLNGFNTVKPSAPPAPNTNSPTNNLPSLSNSNTGNPVGFSSLFSQPSNQNPTPPTTSSSQSMHPRNNSSQASVPPPQGSLPPYPTGSGGQPPYPTGNGGQLPYPTGPGSLPPYPGGQAAQPAFPGGPGSQPTQPLSNTGSYNNPYASNPPPTSSNQYSAYSLPNIGQTQTQGTNPYGQSSNPYQTGNSASGYPQQNPAYSSYPPPPQQRPQQQTPGAPPPYQPPPNNMAGNPNPYGQGNPYAQASNQSAYNNPHQFSNPQSSPGGAYPQQPPASGPYQSQGSYSSGPQNMGYGGYPNYQQQPQHASYQNPFEQRSGDAYNPGGFAPQANERLRAIAGRFEINDALAQRLNLLQQFELVILCDDSGSMNTPVDGTNGTRWDELRAIVQIIIEIGVIFDSNGIDVHFLNRQPMLNVTDARQVVESFVQRPSGMTPLTTSLRRIFQSAASKGGSDKRLLVFVATDGAPTDANGNVDIRGLENLMRNERQAATTFVTFLACTDDEASVSYLSQWDRTMQNVDVVDDYKSERDEVRRVRGPQYPFTFGDYVAKALLGAIDPQIDLLDEASHRQDYR